MDRREELEAFKTKINLTEYAAHLGYAIDTRESSRRSVIMRCPSNDDKIIVTKDVDQHWIYFSVRDGLDRGTVIDFHQRRSYDDLGRTRMALRPWIGQGSLPARPRVETYAKEVLPTPKDRTELLRLFHLAKPVTEHPYLESRGIPKATLALPILEGRIHGDRRGNALFPHYDEQGFSGFEIKNTDFTGFSPGGEKGLWLSRAVGKEILLVVCESAIDAISYQALFPTEGLLLASTGGAWAEKTERLLLEAAKPSGIQGVILAFDNDREGERYAEKAIRCLEPLGKTLTRKVSRVGKDWNDCLQAKVSPRYRQ